MVMRRYEVPLVLKPMDPIYTPCHLNAKKGGTTNSAVDSTLC